MFKGLTYFQVVQFCEHCKPRLFQRFAFYPAIRCYALRCPCLFNISVTYRPDASYCWLVPELLYFSDELDEDLSHHQLLSPIVTIYDEPATVVVRYWLTTVDPAKKISDESYLDVYSASETGQVDYRNQLHRLPLKIDSSQNEVNYHVTSTLFPRVISVVLFIYLVYSRKSTVH